MERPTPIVWFQSLYLAALVARVGIAVVRWQVSDAGAIQIGLIVSLLLWFGVMYRHSKVAAALVVVLFGLVAWWTMRRIVAVGGVTPTEAGYLIAVAFHAGAIACLLHPAAWPWFDKPADANA